jgi:hypothetical protein
LIYIWLTLPIEITCKYPRDIFYIEEALDPINLFDRERPKCQVTGCYEPAQVYVVIKETDVIPTIGRASESYPDRTLMINANSLSDRDYGTDINTFKIILFLCSRHDYDLKYLLKENELEIAKRNNLELK